ncbi:MAG: phosphoglycerol geranylgeranyltransferase [Flavobacteriaceae bacterium]|jgi:phosphoglycerol geranylgeranyltransferase
MKEKRMNKSSYHFFTEASANKTKLLAVLIDPDNFDITKSASFLNNLPIDATHLLVGGSNVEDGKTTHLVSEIKKYSKLPLLLFPGDVSQITNKADGLLFLSLLSGRNPEYLIGQQVKAVSKLRNSTIDVLSTGYILIDGGNKSSVERVSKTQPMPQNNIQAIVDTAMAGELLGKQLIYLEAGSGAKYPVQEDIISAVKKEINIPLIVGGGIKTEKQKQEAYLAGADMVVMGTVFENINL